MLLYTHYVHTQREHTHKRVMYGQQECSHTHTHVYIRTRSTPTHYHTPQGCTRTRSVASGLSLCMCVALASHSLRFTIYSLLLALDGGLHAAIGVSGYACIMPPTNQTKRAPLFWSIFASPLPSPSPLSQCTHFINAELLLAYGMELGTEFDRDRGADIVCPVPNPPFLYLCSVFFREVK